MSISERTPARRHSSQSFGAVVVVAALFLLSACGSSSNDTTTSSSSGTTTTSSSSGNTTSLDNFINNGVTLTYIVDPPNVYEGDDGNITGASAEAMKAILAKLGITNLTFTNVPFGSTIPTLSANRADLTAFIFNIKPDRCSQIAFTNPVYVDRDGAMVQTGNPKNIHSWDDLVSDDSIKIASIRGDAHLDWLKAYNIPDSRVQQFDSLPQAIQAVATGARTSTSTVW